MSEFAEKQQYDAYSKANETVGPEYKVFVLYTYAIAYVRQAKEAIDNKDYDQRYKLVDKACRIINGLRNCLDFDSNIEIANALDGYYKALDEMLLSVQVDNNIETCDEVIENLRKIQQIWVNFNNMEEISYIEAV